MNSAKSKLAAIIIAMLLAVGLSWLGSIDRQSKGYVDEALGQALSAYAVARGVNAVVSVLQSVQVGGSLGASFNLAPGEVLDPINDLVERYASVMEFAIGSLMAQKLLIEITSNSLFSLLLTLSVAAFILCALFKRGPMLEKLFRAVLSLIFLRFAIVLAIIANGWVDQAFINDSVNQQINQMDLLATDVASHLPSQPQETDEQSGFFDSLSSGVQNLTERAKALLGQLDVSAANQALEEAVPSILDLMMVFVLKTLILPLLFLYGVKVIFSRLWRIEIPLTQILQQHRPLGSPQAQAEIAAKQDSR